MMECQRGEVEMLVNDEPVTINKSIFKIVVPELFLSN